MNIRPGQVWMRRCGQVALVRRVISTDGVTVKYKVLNGPHQFGPSGVGECRLKTFLKNSREIAERSDWSSLDGIRKHEVYLFLGHQGNELFRCSQRKADWYVRKGYAREVRPGVFQLTDDTVEKRLAELYGSNRPAEYFLTAKNDHCVVCGRPDRLTRHHVVPRRYKQTLPLRWRRHLSNIVFLCIECHKKYEETTEPGHVFQGDGEAFVQLWADHFLDVMSPRHLPPGWVVMNTRAMRQEESALQSETGQVESLRETCGPE